MHYFWHLTLSSTIFFNTSGLYYKRVTIVINTSSVVKVMVQIVASLTIVIDAPSVVKVTLQIVASLMIVIDDAS